MAQYPALGSFGRRFLRRSLKIEIHSGDPHEKSFCKTRKFERKNPLSLIRSTVSLSHWGTGTAWDKDQREILQTF